MKKIITIILTLVSLGITAQTSEELEMIKMINQLRTNPKSFIPYIEERIKGLETMKANPKFTITLRSNKSNITEYYIVEYKKLIVFLNKQKPVSVLELSNKLYLITQNQANYLDSTKQLTHIGPNGETIGNRMKKMSSTVSENCAWGSDDVVETLIVLLLDYGVPNKGHRTNLFNPNMTRVAVAKVNQYWVQDFIK